MEKIRSSKMLLMQQLAPTGSVTVRPGTSTRRPHTRCALTFVATMNLTMSVRSLTTLQASPSPATASSARLTMMDRPASTAAPWAVQGFWQRALPCLSCLAVGCCKLEAPPRLRSVVIRSGTLPQLAVQQTHRLLACVQRVTQASCASLALTATE